MLLRFVGEHLDKSPHLEFDLAWLNALLMTHGRMLRDQSGESASVFRLVQKALGDFEHSISQVYVFSLIQKILLVFNVLMLFVDAKRTWLLFRI